MAEYYAERSVHVDLDDIFLTTSTSEAYSYAFRLLCNHGDEILIPAPSYPLFDFLADIQDIKPARYPLVYDHGWQMDFHALEQAITPRTRAVVVVHPNNPTGHFTKRAEAEKLNAICAERGLAIIVDEVFLDFCLSAERPSSFAGSSEALTFTLSGVSMKFLDYDNDGWPDILQLNGAMLDNVQLYHSEVTYKEPLLMYRNLGKGQFAKVSDSLGADFVRPIAGRGLATSDFDNDGDIDIAVNVRGDYPELLRNDGGNANHWLEVLLIGTKSNRDGIGASLKLTSEGVSHVEQSKGGMSYMSASDPRIHFGLGKRTKIDSLEITWPSGQIDKLTNLAADKIIAVKEGAGIVTHPFPKVTTR